MISYAEVLNRCLEAVREGRDLETVLASLPERYTADLRRDSALVSEVQRAAATTPGPGEDARRLANARLQTELVAAREAPATPRRSWPAFRLPRVALAALALAAVLIGASFLFATSDGGNGAVEAATLEGVVIANSGDRLTVQTPDTLEQVRVPRDAHLSDETGANLDLASIEVGQVVIVQGKRPPGGVVAAVNVQRVVNGLPGWCKDAPERCRQVAGNLRDAVNRCRQDPQSCPALQDRIDALISEAGDVAAIEELKERCGEDSNVCGDFIARCRQHTDICIAPDPPGPVFDRLEDAGERLQALRRLCGERDTKACRQIAQICAAHPVLCPDTAPRAPIENRSEPSTPVAQPTATQRVSPSPTPVADRRVR